MRTNLRELDRKGSKTRVIALVFLWMSSSASAASLGQVCGTFFGWLTGSRARAEAADRNLPRAVIDRSVASAMQERVQALVRKHPGHVALVNDVVFEVPNHQGSHRRQVLVVSTEGLIESEQSALLRDYLSAFSPNSVSFPLGSAAGHLYTRVGANTFNFLFGDLKDGPYRLESGSERLEPVLLLTPEEQGRLETYLTNAQSDTAHVLGDFSVSGPGAVLTEGRLDRNLPVWGTHNCTSWLCTAPIGNEGQSVFQVAGAQRAWNIHTNPGWWSSWLAGGAPSARVPLVVYFSPRSLQTALQSVKPNTPFQWNFNAH